MSPASVIRAALAGILAVLAILVGAAGPAPAATLPPPAAGEAWVASVIYPTVARTAPRARARIARRLSTSTQWGTPVQLLVLARSDDAAGQEWLRVLLDDRPNGLSAWIPAGDTLLALDPWSLTVSLEQRRARVYRHGRLVRSFAVVVGKPSTPTPTGLFAIVAELPEPDPGEFFGSWVLPLTAHSQVLRSYEGGDGEVALHGRGGASLLDPLGSARSHGCVRLANAAIGWIAAHVPPGTPVRVRKR